MEILIALFGAFTLASIVALVKFEGNPLFAFSLLLSLASLVWMINMARHGSAGMGRSRRKKTGRRQ